MKMTKLIAASLLLIGAAEIAAAQQPAVRYNYAELRYVDVDVAGGSGLQVGGSYRFDNNWFVLGSLTDIGFDASVDSTTIELGGGYVFAWKPDWDLLASVRFVDVSVDTPFGDGDDDGLLVEAGTRGLLTPEFEVRGSVNHTTIGDGDTFLKIAGDYYFAEQFAAGLSLEFAGDVDVLSIGARWFFE